jgi:hypothetical protein
MVLFLACLLTVVSEVLRKIEACNAFIKHLEILSEITTIHLEVSILPKGSPLYLHIKFPLLFFLPQQTA